MEDLDTVVHLVVLRDDMREKALGFSLIFGAFIHGISVIGQPSCLAKFLEYHAVHASAEVLIEESFNGSPRK